MGKIEENKQQKKERLLDTAFQLFTAKGIAKTSISDIVNNAGVAKGTFYLYFKDKYDIANKLIAKKANTLCNDAFARLQQSQVETLEDKIIFVVDDLLNELQKNHMLLRFINKNLSWGIFKNALLRAEDQDELELESFLTSIFGSTVSNWRDLESMLYLIIELVGSSCHSVILEKDPMPLDQFKPHLYRAIRQIVAGYVDGSQTT